MIEKYLKGSTKRRDLEERLLKSRILPLGSDTVPTPLL